MKVGNYRLYIYVDYYFELLSSNICIYLTSKMRVIDKLSPEKTKNNSKHEKRDNTDT